MINVKWEQTKTKYGNKITYLDGIKFHSQGEASRYLTLKHLERLGEIKDLKLQPKYLLMEKFTTKQGKKCGAIHYIADFTYFDVKLNSMVVEDFKGCETKDFKIKMKLFLNRYRDFIYILSQG